MAGLGVGAQMEEVRASAHFLAGPQGKGKPLSAGLRGKADEVCSLIQLFFAQSPALIIIL